MSMKRLIVCLAGALLATGCARHASEADADTASAPDSLIHISSASLETGEITVEPLVARPLADTLMQSGEIQPNPLPIAHVSARVTGTVHSVRVVAGDRVVAGQTLATLYSPEFLAIAGDYLLAHERAESAARGGSPDVGALQAVAQSSRRRLELLGVPAELINKLHESHEVAT